MTTLPLLAEQMRRHNFRDELGPPSDALASLLEDWKGLTADKMYKPEGMHRTEGEIVVATPFPAPLIADGIMGVTATIGGTRQTALTHARWNADKSQCEEQWVMFDTSANNVSFTFTLDGGGTANLVIDTDPYPARLPAPKKDHPTGPVTLFWYPFTNGHLVSPAAFHTGVKAGLLASPAVRYRYVWGKLVVETLDNASPTPPSEYIPDDEVAGRGWEEEMYNSSTAATSKRGWIYGEWEQPMVDNTYTPVKIHVAWAAYQLAPPGASMGAARTPATTLNLTSWLAAVRSRLGVSDTNPGKYASGTARIYSAIPVAKP